MPIQFHCSHCGQFMSISRRKAGHEVTCPRCIQRTVVPVDEVAETTAEDDSSRSLELMQPGRAGSLKSADAAAWKHHPNAWTDAEDDETHDDLHLQKKKMEEPGLDMTPMVDVMMLLLIFFMITASFVTQQSLETTPPESEGEGAGRVVAADDVASESVVVKVDDSDNIFVDDVPVAGINELVDVLRAKMASENKTEMLIESEPAATHGQVVAVTDAGITVQMQRIRRSSKRAED